MQKTANNGAWQQQQKALWLRQDLLTSSTFSTRPLLLDAQVYFTLQSLQVMPLQEGTRNGANLCRCTVSTV